MLNLINSFIVLVPLLFCNWVQEGLKYSPPSYGTHHSHPHKSESLFIFLLAGGIAVPAEPSRQEEREGSEEEHPDSMSTPLAGSMVSQSRYSPLYVYTHSAADFQPLLKQALNSIHNFLPGENGKLGLDTLRKWQNVVASLNKAQCCNM